MKKYISVFLLLFAFVIAGCIQKENPVKKSDTDTTNKDGKTTTTTKDEKGNGETNPAAAAGKSAAIISLDKGAGILIIGAEITNANDNSISSLLDSKPSLTAGTHKEPFKVVDDSYKSQISVDKVKNFSDLKSQNISKVVITLNDGKDDKEVFSLVLTKVLTILGKDSSPLAPSPINLSAPTNTNITLGGLKDFGTTGFSWEISKLNAEDLKVSGDFSAKADGTAIINLSPLQVQKDKVTATGGCLKVSYTEKGADLKLPDSEKRLVTVPLNVVYSDCVDVTFVQK